MMMGPSRRVAALAVLAVAACGAGDNSVDPDDLELRDLLGISPEIASAWTATQRVSARRVLLSALAVDGEPARAALDPTRPPAPDPDDRVLQLIALDDARRTADGSDPRGVVRIVVGAHDAALLSQLAPATAAVLLEQDALAAARPPSTGPALHEQDALSAARPPSTD